MDSVRKGRPKGPPGAEQRARMDWAYLPHKRRKVAVLEIRRNDLRCKAVRIFHVKGQSIGRPRGNVRIAGVDHGVRFLIKRSRTKVSPSTVRSSEIRSRANR